MPCPALVAFAVWSVVLVLTRIVSVASMSAGAALALAALLLSKFGLAGIEPPLVYFAAAVAALIIITHRSNIIRLVHGTESRIQFRPGKKEPASTGRPS
jgi:glycerol-3-phosphate acyltransferase PlsY